MKHLITTITLVLIGIIGIGQDLYLKEVMAYDIYSGNNYLYVEADYDDNWKVTAYREYQSWGDTIKEIIYNNDTIVKINFSGLTRYFVHGQDTIKVYDSNGDEQFYVVNDDYQIIKGGNSLEMEWVNDNMVKLYHEDNLMEAYLYTGFKNPYYNMGQINYHVND